MKKFVSVVLLVFVFSWGVSVSSGYQRRRVLRRTVVVVHKNWPMRRALRQVVIHPLRVQWRIAPSLFLPLVVWGGAVIATAPLRDVLIWEDGENLSQDEEWTEFALNCDNTGIRLWTEVVAGKVQFDWAEVVFANGETQVVDMNEWERGPGYYELLKFQAGRKVDHVRMVARAVTPEARVVLKMEK